jgi:hypothetical protein
MNIYVTSFNDYTPILPKYGKYFKDKKTPEEVIHGVLKTEGKKAGRKILYSLAKEAIEKRDERHFPLYQKRVRLTRLVLAIFDRLEHHLKSKQKKAAHVVHHVQKLELKRLEEHKENPQHTVIKKENPKPIICKKNKGQKTTKGQVVVKGKIVPAKKTQPLAPPQYPPAHDIISPTPAPKPTLRPILPKKKSLKFGLGLPADILSDIRQRKKPLNHASIHKWEGPSPVDPNSLQGQLIARLNDIGKAMKSSEEEIAAQEYDDESSDSDGDDQPKYTGNINGHDGADLINIAANHYNGIVTPPSKVAEENWDDK